MHKLGYTATIHNRTCGKHSVVGSTDYGQAVATNQPFERRMYTTLTARYSGLSNGGALLSSLQCDFETNLVRDCYSAIVGDNQTNVHLQTPVFAPIQWPADRWSVDTLSAVATPSLQHSLWFGTVVQYITLLA